MSAQFFWKQAASSLPCNVPHRASPTPQTRSYRSGRSDLWSAVDAGDVGVPRDGSDLPSRILAGQVHDERICSGG